MKEASVQSRYEKGFALLAEIDRSQAERIIAGLADIAPDFARYLVEFAFGDIYSRPGLDPKARQIATMAALTALGALPQLKVHIHFALELGCSREEIVEIIMTCGFYMTMARMTETLQVDVDAPGGEAIVKELERLR